MTVPEVAFSLKMHAITSRDVSHLLRGMVARRPRVAFRDLTPGESYLQPVHGGHRLVLVHRVTPARRQAVVSRGPDAEPYRANAGDHHEPLIHLDPDLLSLVGVEHADVVAAAVARGLDVPPDVRREYPDLFVAVPARFDLARPGGDDVIPAAERLRATLAPAFMSLHLPDEADVDRWIERAHRDRAAYAEEGTRRAAANPAVAADYDRAAAEFHDLVDYYRWIRPLVAPGGVFHVPGQAPGDGENAGDSS